MYDVTALVEEPLLFEPLAASLRGAAPSYLRSVKIKLTARCNLRCQMCRYGRGWKPPELDGARWRGLLDEMAAFGCRKVHFSGGEVLLRSDLEELVAHACALRMKVTLTSNLTLLTHDRAKALLRTKLNGLSTSLDGASAKTHDKIRGIAGSFKRTLRALARVERLRRHAVRPQIRVNFVMMRENFREYPELVRVAAEHGACDVVPMPVDTKKEYLRLSKRLVREYNDEVAPRVREARALAGMSLDEERIHPYGRSARAVAESAEGRYAADYYRTHPCFAPFLHMFVAWDGKVYLCCMTNGRIPPLGDLSQESVAEVFRGAPFQALRRRMLGARLEACHTCDMYLPENRALEKALPVVQRRVLPLVGQ